MNEPNHTEEVLVTITVHSASGHDVFSEGIEKAIQMIGDAITKHGKWLYVAGKRVKHNPNSPESTETLRQTLTETPQARLTGSLRGGASLSSMTIAELRNLAKGGVVRGYSQLSKADLIEALEEAGVGGEPVKSPASKKTAKKASKKIPEARTGETPVFEGTFQPNGSSTGRKVQIFSEVKPRNLSGFRDCILVMNNSKNRKLHIEVDPRSAPTVIVEVMAALMEYAKDIGVVTS